MKIFNHFFKLPFIYLFIQPYENTLLTLDLMGFSVLTGSMKLCHVTELQLIKPFSSKLISNEPNSLCRVDRPVSIHLVCQKSCVFGVWRDVVGLLIANPSPFESKQKVEKWERYGHSKLEGLNDRKNISYTLKMHGDTCTHQWANNLMWTYKHYVPPSPRGMIYKMNRTLFNNIHFCVQHQRFTSKKGSRSMDVSLWLFKEP